MQDIRERYNKLNVQLNLGKQILFESNKIELNIPTDGTIVNGWKIIPLKPPEVSNNYAIITPCTCARGKAIIIGWSPSVNIVVCTKTGLI